MSLKNQNELFERLGFDEKDLDDNRKNRLSYQQSKKLIAAAQKTKLVILGILFLSGIILLPLSHVIQAQPGNFATGVSILVGWVIWAGLLVFRLQRGDSYSADVTQGRVDTVRGEVECSASATSNRRIHYQLRVGTTTFEKVEPTVYEAFNHKDSYTIYYAPCSKMIVAAEHLEAYDLD